MLEFNNNCGCDSGSLNGFTDPSCPAPSVVTWASIQGKPSCFTPCAHTHVPGDIIGLEAYIQNVEFANAVITTNSIQLTTPSGVLNANLRLSANAGVGYKVPLSILSDGLIGQIPYASGLNAGILSAADWTTFNNKFNTPSGTVFQYVRGDGSLGTLPTFGTLSSVGIAMPAAFGVVNSPLTSNGTITINALGTSAQYIRGDGTLATFPTIPSLPSFAVGSVPFGNGTGLIENNTKFFWDNTAFKLKLTDSKLEFLKSTLLGSSLFEYKDLSGVATLTIDQTDNNSAIGMWVKARAFNNTTGLGQTAGFIFGSVDGVDTTVGQVGMMWATPNTFGGGNQLYIKNVYDSTGLIKIQANAYTQVDGLAIKQSSTYTFSNVNTATSVIYPYNVLRFNYGGTSGTNSITLPFNAFLAIPDGYIVILKAINTHGGTGQNVVVNVNGPSGQTAEPFTFTKSRESVIYRYDLAANNWDIIAAYNV